MTFNPATTDAFRNITVVESTFPGATTSTVAAEIVGDTLTITGGFGITLTADPVTDSIVINNTGDAVGAYTEITDANANETYYPVFSRPPNVSPYDTNPVTGQHQLDTVYIDKTTTPLTYNPSTGVFTAVSFAGAVSASTFTANTALVGASANFTRFPGALAVVSTTDAGIQQNESLNIGLIAEATGSGATYGAGLYGVGYTSVGARGTGVIGEGHVSASTDSASAIGVRGYSNDTHASGLNVGLYADASGSSIGNYALYINSGDINTSNVSPTWLLRDNQSASLTFDSAGKTGILLIKTTDAAEGVTMSGTLGVTGATTLSSTLSVTGHTTFEGVTSTGATGTGKIVYDTSPTISGASLSNTSGMNFASGVTISSFSSDSSFANNAADSVPVESATRGYIDRRLGLDHAGNPVATLNLIGSGYLPLDGSLTIKGNINMGAFNITNAGTITGTFSGNLTGNVTGNVSGNAGTVTNGVVTTGSYSNPGWITALSLSQGGTGASSANGALTNLVPVGEVSGYVLKTSGRGGYYWAAETGASTVVGTRLDSSRVEFIATSNQTLFTGVGSYTAGTGQLRVYIDGARQFPSAYTETSSTSFTLSAGVPAGTKVLAEVDAYIDFTVVASAVTFSPVGAIAATDVQAAIAELDTEKAPKESPTFTGTVSGITSAMVGLGNVTNESKATMFTNPAFTGTPTGITATHVGLGNVTNESKATMFTDSSLTGTTTIAKVLFAANGFSIEQSGTKIYFKYNGIDVLSIDSSGNIIGKANITAYGTP